MSTLIHRSKAVLSWLWKQTGAVVGVVLIVVALIIGIRLGERSPQAAAPTQAAAHDHDASQPQSKQQYTCSMHPLVRMDNPDDKCPICGMDLIPVSDASPTSGGAGTLELTAEAAAISNIETAEVTRDFPIARTRLYGKVTYDETSVARLTAYFPGRIDRLFINYEGVLVARGDHLAEIYSPELLAAFEELRQAAVAADQSDTTSDLVREATRDTLEASREKLRLYGLTDEQIASIEEGTFNKDRLTIYAPIGGVVTHVAVREGDYVTTGEPIATVANLSRLWLDLQAYESQLPMLRWGQSVTFTAEAHPGETFSGRISFIEPLVDDKTRTAVVRVAVDNADGRLKPGMFVSAVVRSVVSANGVVMGDELAGHWVCTMHPTIVRDGPGACDICGMDLVPAASLGVVGDPSRAVEPMVIPKTAVLFTGTRSVVYVQLPEAPSPTYEAREIVLGPRVGDRYIVRSGLMPGERVVVNGAFRIDSAMQIAAKPSMMSPQPEDDTPAGTPDESAMPSMSMPPISAVPQAVPEAFTASLDPVYEAYIKAQTALVGDDLDGYRGAMGDLDSAAAAIDTAPLDEAARTSFQKTSAPLLANAAPADLEAARAQFEHITQTVLALDKRFGHGGDSWNLVHCPMALDGKGADWIQLGDQISNPYMGQRMPKCGSVIETLAPTATSGQTGGNHD